MCGVAFVVAAGWCVRLWYIKTQVPIDKSAEHEVKIKELEREIALIKKAKAILDSDS